MPERDKPLFLARESYRHRRMIDAARLLPVFGTVLFLVPILWDLAGPQAADPEAPAGLAQRGLYLFAVWGLLVLAASGLAVRLRPVTGPDIERLAPERAAVQAPQAGPASAAGSLSADAVAAPVDGQD